MIKPFNKNKLEFTPAEALALAERLTAHANDALESKTDIYHVAFSLPMSETVDDTTGSPGSFTFAIIKENVKWE